MMDSAACWQNSVAMHQACGTVRLCPGLNSLFATNATTHERWTCSYPWHTGGCFDFGSVWRERNMSHCGDFYKCLRKAEARDNVSVLHSSLASAAFGTNHHLAAIQRNACASTTLFSLCLSKVVHHDGRYTNCVSQVHRVRGASACTFVARPSSLSRACPLETVLNSTFLLAECCMASTLRKCVCTILAHL